MLYQPSALWDSRVSRAKLFKAFLLRLGEHAPMSEKDRSAWARYALEALK